VLHLVLEQVDSDRAWGH